MPNNFTVVGAPTFAPGKFGNALTCSAGNYLTLPDASPFRSSTGFTVEYWQKTTGLGVYQAVFARAGSEWFGIHNGRLFGGAAGVGQTDVVINDGIWHHIAWVSNGSTTVGYLDGAQFVSTPYSISTQYWPSSGSGSTLYIGARSETPDGAQLTGYFTGQIDDLRISKVARYSGPFEPPGNYFVGDANTLGLYRFTTDGTDSAADTTPAVPNPVPTTPKNVTATAAPGQVTITWNASSDDVAVTGYRLYRAGGLVGTTRSLTYTDTGLAGGIRYGYRVAAVDGDGNMSDPSPIAAATTPAALKPGAPPVILDQDFSSDIDDAGALAVLEALADLGECQLIGMMVSSTNGGAALAMDAINTYYGRPGIPIGVRPDVQGVGGYPAVIASEFPHALTSAAACPTAATLYRTLLAAAADNSVVICTTGYMTNLKALLATTGDAISPLTGPQLVAAKVNRLVCMGGGYPNGGEFNFTASGDDSAYQVVNNWPTAAVYSGFEIGSAIYTGGPSLYALTPPSNPIRRAWETFHDPGIRASFDQTAAYHAVRTSENFFGINNVGRNNANSDGTNYWTATPDPTGLADQAYLLERTRFPVQAAIDTLTCAPPAAGPPAAPAAPTNLRATVGAPGVVELVWTRNSHNETAVVVERYDNGAFTPIATRPRGATTYTDSTAGTTSNRCYRVRAANTTGRSRYATVAYYTGWTEINLATPGNVPLYSYYQNNLRYSRALTEDHIAVNNDSTHGATATVTTDVAATGQEGSLCVYFLYQNPTNWYRLTVNDNVTKFEKRAGGTITTVGATAAGISIGSGTALQPWRLDLTPIKVTFTSPTVTLTVTETFAFTTGKIGFGALSRGPVWSNIMLFAPPPATTADPLALTRKAVGQSRWARVGA